LRELDGLPAPVQRYFRAVLNDGQPIHRPSDDRPRWGVNMAAAVQQWKRFASRHWLQRGARLCP
jgi:hypothetical protein